MRIIQGFLKAWEVGRECEVNDLSGTQGSGK